MKSRIWIATACLAFVCGCQEAKEESPKKTDVKVEQGTAIDPAKLLEGSAPATDKKEETTPPAEPAKEATEPAK